LLTLVDPCLSLFVLVCRAPVAQPVAERRALSPWKAALTLQRRICPPTWLWVIVGYPQMKWFTAISYSDLNYGCTTLTFDSLPAPLQRVECKRATCQQKTQDRVGVGTCHDAVLRPSCNSCFSAVRISHLDRPDFLKLYCADLKTLLCLHLYINIYDIKCHLYITLLYIYIINQKTI